MDFLFVCKKEKGGSKGNELQQLTNLKNSSALSSLGTMGNLTSMLRLACVGSVQLEECFTLTVH